jgi:hypothetical protein
VFGSFGQIDGFAELFEGDRLALRHVQRAAVGELNCPDRGSHPILRVPAALRRAQFDWLLIASLG